MIDIVNQNGTKMDTLSKDSWWGMKTFPKVIAPGEKGYFYGYSYFDLPDTPGSYSLRVGKPTLETKSDSIGKPLAINNMKLSSVKDSNGKTYPKVTFTVKNNSGSYQRDIQTGVIFYDKNGHVIGIEGNSGRGASLSAGDESGEHSYGGLALSPGCTYDRISTNVKVFSRSIY